MPTNPASQSKRRTCLKWIALSVTCVATIWFAVILWWQTTQPAVKASDIVTYLVALPILVLTCAGLFVWGASRRRHSAPSEIGDAAAPGTSSDAHPRVPVGTLPVLGAWAATSLGATADEFTEALHERKSRPTPDEMLTDEDGFPVLSSRVKDLDTLSVRHSLTQAVADGLLKGAPDMDNWRDAPIRALALLESVFDQLLQDWPLSATAGTESRGDKIAALPLLRGSGGVPLATEKPFKLYVTLLVSATFESYEKELARIYAIERLHTLPLSDESFTFDLIAADDDATALVLADQFRRSACGAEDAQALLLLACDSSLCPTLAEEWSARRQLFEPRRPNGLMMGEGAFATLYANDKALQAAATNPLCRLTSLSRAQRESSADGSGKSSHVCLDGAIESALRDAGISGAMVNSVVCDADHRTNRTLECIGAMMTHTPQLDAIQNRLAINEACGHLGAASVAGLLAAAAIEADKRGDPILVFNVSHALDRAAAVLLPDAAATSSTLLQAA